MEKMESALSHFVVMGAESENQMEESSSSGDLSDLLPLQLIESEKIPPAANQSGSGSTAVVDWLPDLAGYSWVAYGASSLLVISHFPSPLSPQQSKTGPIFRHVFDLSSPNSAGDVAGVSWSPAVPSSGDLAVAVDSRVFIFQFDSVAGSFCWSQTALLVQSAKVEAISWTGCGDGIISGGADVVLWKRSAKSWEIAWKSGMKVSQTLVSATWSLDGPAASGAYPTKLYSEASLMTSSASNSVNIFQNDGKSGYAAIELRHPQPVLAIQWRPSGGSQLNRDALYTPRHVLLTSCLDGAVRLWCEIDGTRIRKGNKDNRDPFSSRRSFCAVAIIEINQSLNGSLGADIFINWALEMEGVVCVSGGASHILPEERLQNDEVGRCEWLIGLGPGNTLTFWAVHFLDDVATMRSPRVTLWKRQEVLGPALRSFSRNNHPMCFEGSHFKKVVMWRNRLFGPPTICSLIQFFPCNSVAWSVLCSQSLVNVEDQPSCRDETDNNLTCESVGILDTLGHTGKILQVAVHPLQCEAELAVSLDSNGLLIFWSTSTCSNSISGLPILNPSWKIIGKVIVKDIISPGMSLFWAPSWLEEDRILFICHVQGIDCLIVRTCDTGEEKISCHKLGTIPFIGQDHLDGPDKISSVPLHSTCKATYKFNHFLLLGVWMNKFQAESWEVTLHSYDLSGSCSWCNFDTTSDAGCGTSIYKADFAGKTYCMIVNSCSSYMPDVHDQVTSIDMVSPSIVLPALQQKLDLVNDSRLHNFPYHMATGHSDGRSRLWRFNLTELSIAHTTLELVGVFGFHQGPVSAISVADWGQKIATISSTGHTNGAKMLCIWEPLHLACGGTVELEDKICLNEEVVALHWLLMENMLFIGVCFHNELHIYSRKVCSVQTSLYRKKPSKEVIWVCIAVVRTSPTISDFLLGPRGAITIIHEKYFSLFSQWSISKGNIHPNDGELSTDRSITNGMDVDGPSIFTGKIHIFEESSFERSSQEGTSSPLMKVYYARPSCLLANGTQPIDKLQNEDCFLKMTEVAEKLCGPLPFYHPEALLMNIYSGNWKRAWVAVCHLVQCLASNSTVEKKLISAKSSLVVRQIELSIFFEGQLSSDRASSRFQWSKDFDNVTWSSHSEREPLRFAGSSVSDVVSNTFTASASSSKSGFHEVLEKLHVLEAVTGSQRMKMFSILELLREISDAESASAHESLDEPGKRFWCAIRLQQLDFRRKYGRIPSVEELLVDSRQIGWAFHSDCPANLFSTILPSEPTWEEMRKIGVGFWFTNLTDLRAKMEKLARCQYLKSKDPKACALLYVALNRLQVLAGLFKISKDEKDKPLVAFLSRNFQEEKNKAAALKNAYVLMGRHQFELAIAFFLLGGDIMSAISVCAKTLGDDQLALVICRLVEGQGGPAERHLISRILLPSAIEKGDYWFASILEWALGNYLQSFLILLGLQGDSNVSESEKLFRHDAFVDPSIGQYCQVLAAKNSLRNAIGEKNASMLSRWAAVMTASAFNKCGLPLEALECLSSSASILGVTDKRTDTGNSEVLPQILRPAPSDSSMWMSHEVASDLEYQVKLDLAMQYIMKLMREHQGLLNTSVVSTEVSDCSLEHEMSQYGALLESFEQKMESTLRYLEQKFYLIPDLLLNKISGSLKIHWLLPIGCHLSDCVGSQVRFPILSHIVGGSSQLLKQFMNTAEFLSCYFSRFVTVSSIASFPTLSSSQHNVSVMKPYVCLQYLQFHTRGFISSSSCLRAALMILYNGSTKDLILHSIAILDLFNYCIYFASALLQRNIKALTVMLRPVLISCIDGNCGEVDITCLKRILGQVMEALGANKCEDVHLETGGSHHDNGGDKILTLPQDAEWILLGVCLWQHLSKLIKKQLNRLPDVSGFSASATGVSSDPVDSDSLRLIRQVLVIFTEAIGNTLTHVSSHSASQLAVFFWQQFQNGTSIPTLTWLEEYSQFNPQEHLSGTFSSSELLNEEASMSELLAHVYGDPKIASELLAQLPMKLLQLIHLKPDRQWNHLNHLKMGVMGEHERLECYKQEGMFDSSPRGNENGSPSAGSRQGHNLLDSDQGAGSMTKVVPFHHPREIYRRNGELLEALCINSVDQQQAALASNKKGINFFNWGDGFPSRDPSYYIWSEADWPRNGWAGTESTPVPTCVSPGVGLGNSEGAHLGLGGATVGLDSQARLGGDLTGGGAFGIPGYAGIGATGMGWGVQEDFDNFIDPPATLENIKARTLASHPSRPLFLVGSSNTHIYLWEFGEEKAAATYGVLPAANVPPPYALASITALRFDRCGHRFANSASDGTVCTWQLEVGGRSNVRPTESSLCFNGHAADISYVATSGSIIAAAGYSSNGVNVVIWDTLAPPTSSRASVMCHEGGACSIGVFDNDVGTGSISPLIVTGGKGGDVGLHDFRYIATGKTKRHRHSNATERISDTSTLDLHSEVSSSSGDQNRHGMLWYIPKAHSASVTKISTIPNTSFFLTGSKDGDVKLWDARRASLVFHWPKLHERHTFLQRGSQSFGGVTRVGVTDIQVISDGFITCGGDGSVKMVQINNSPW